MQSLPKSPGLSGVLIADIIQSSSLRIPEEDVYKRQYHMWVYLVKIAATIAFCFFFVSIGSSLFGNENSIVGVVVLLCLMVFRNADLGLSLIHIWFYHIIVTSRKKALAHIIKGTFRSDHKYR